jgi:hypothetical protein
MYVGHCGFNADLGISVSTHIVRGLSMAKEVHNIETAAPETVFREVLISVQNSSNALLTLATFALTNGQWDPNAPTGIPQQGYGIAPATTPVWGNYTPTAFTAVQGFMTINGNSSTITVNWQWVYGSNPSSTVSVNGTTLTASVTLANPTSNTITAQVVISGNA